MHDLKAIRDDPSAFDEGLRRRGLPPQAAAILEIDQDRRRLQQVLEEMQARRNSVSKEIGGLRAKGQAEAAAAAAAEVTRIKEYMPAAERAAREGAVIEACWRRFPTCRRRKCRKAPTQRRMSRSAVMAIPSRFRRRASMRRASISSSANPWG
jgi:seryl-tRNA synthetase